MGRPLIAITAATDDGGISSYIKQRYATFIWENGGMPVTVPLVPDEVGEVLDRVDGVLIPGGADINPRLYGEDALDAEMVPSVLRDTLEVAMIRAAVERDVPLLGICRGCQMLNVALGGTLYQDLKTQHPSVVAHRQDAPYEGTYQHEISLVEGTLLHSIIELPQVMVDSIHHQGVKDLAPCLVVNAYAPDGLVEAASMPDRRFCLGVQFHPEYLPRDAYSRRVARAFIEACR